MDGNTVPYSFVDIAYSLCQITCIKLHIQEKEKKRKKKLNHNYHSKDSVILLIIKQKMI